MIEVTGLTTRYGNRTVVDRMTFTVTAGKVTGFTRPDSGEVRYAGARYCDLPYPTKVVGAVLEARLHPGRSARNHLRAAAALSSIPTAKTIVTVAFAAALSALGLAAGFAGSVLSGIGIGDTSTMLETSLWATAFTAMAGLLGLGWA